MLASLENALKLLHKFSALSVFLLVQGVAIDAATAGDARLEPNPWREISAGADVSEDVWLLYTASTIAPFGNLYDDGFRLRAVTGYGQYSYQRGTFEHHAVVTFADVAAGYQMQMGSLTAKAFFGLHAIDHQVRPLDSQNGLAGFNYGPVGSIELWLNVGDIGWTSLDASYSTVHDAAAGRFRAGYRALPGFSVGPEALLNQTAADIIHKSTEYRGGGFVRYDWAGGEVSVSGGAKTNELSASDDAEGYLTANWLMQY